MPHREAVNAQSGRIAYFSMEMGLEPNMPTYSGGLGVLAGDTLRAAADLQIPIVGISLLYRKGYFRQSLDSNGNQTEVPFDWNPKDFLVPVDTEVTVEIEGRTVYIQAWRYNIESPSGDTVPVYFLDTNLKKNSPWDRTLSDYLYGGDQRYRFCQETLLGIGGIAILRMLGYTNIKAFHMNEGHSALLALALLKERIGKKSLSQAAPEDIKAVHRKCVFTTHTPVPAGHDKFPMELVKNVLGEEMASYLASTEANHSNILNLTSLALMHSWYINGVSYQHEKISQDMFPEYPINFITNGVHAMTWTSDPFQRLYDRHMFEWRRDSLYLRYAVSIPLEEIQAAHRKVKQNLILEVEEKTGNKLSPNALTIGFARRATTYKRADLLFTDIERLRKIVQKAGTLQVIFSGKAHPNDEPGKEMIRRIFKAAETLKEDIPIVYIEGYNMAQAKRLCAGVDLWLNTPLKPLEASGTSGMKAALNGVPSLSVLDGWWIEGHQEGVTGWSIEGDGPDKNDPCAECESLYHKLENIIIPMYYKNPEQYTRIMRSTISLNGSFFTAQRMMFQYLKNAYNSNHDSF